MKRLGSLLVIVATTALMSLAQDRPKAKKQANYPAQLEGANVEVYKTVGDVKLNMYIFNPAGHKPSDRRPAIVFFFGGGWRSGSPSQFQNHCRYLASRGMIAMAADYRVLDRHGTPALQCVEDAKSAVRWVRANAERLGVDPDRVAAGGGSAGGHIAACTGVIKGRDDAREDPKISSVPNALVLFNPALVLAPVDGADPFPTNFQANMKERMGVDPIELSPFHHVTKSAPPTIVFHGTADSTVPFKTAKQFSDAMSRAGNSCRLVAYDGQPHGFFNHGRGDNRFYNDTLRVMDEFLVQLGFLTAPERG